MALTLNEYSEKTKAAVHDGDTEQLKDILLQPTDAKEESQRQVFLKLRRNACILALEYADVEQTKLLFTRELAFIDDKLYPAWNQELMDGAIVSDSPDCAKFLRSKGLLLEFPVWNMLRKCVEGQKIELTSYLVTIPGITFQLPWPFDQSLISIAARKANLELVKILLDSDAKEFLNTKCVVNGYSALHYCLETKKDDADILEIAKTLVTHGTDVDVDLIEGKRQSKRTPLLMAAENKLYKVVMFLIEKGANIHIRDGNDKSVLWYLSKHDMKSELAQTCAKQLLSAGVVIDSDLIERKNVDLLKIILECGCQENIRSKDDKSLLMILCETGDVELVDQAIKLGANIHGRDKNRLSILYYCARSPQKSKFHDLLKLIFDAGVECEPDTSTASAVREAVYRSDIEALRLLREHNADIHDLGERQSILHVAAQTFSFGEHLDELFGFELDVDQKDFIKWDTPLIVAASLGYIGLMEQLISNGCTVDAWNDNGVSALMKATEKCHVNAVTLLLNAGADVNLKSYNGKTALQYLEIKDSADGHVPLLKTLLDRGGGPSAHIPDMNDLTLFEHMILESRFSSIWYLITANCQMDPLTPRICVNHLNEGFLQIAVALYESGVNMTDIARLLSVETRLEFSKYCSGNLTLKSQCRRSIRRHIGPSILDKMDQLPLPSQLKSFILLDAIIPEEFKNLKTDVPRDLDKKTDKVLADMFRWLATRDLPPNF